MVGIAGTSHGLCRGVSRGPSHATTGHTISCECSVPGNQQSSNKPSSRPRSRDRRRYSCAGKWSTPAPTDACAFPGGLLVIRRLEELVSGPGYFAGDEPAAVAVDVLLVQ